MSESGKVTTKRSDVKRGSSAFQIRKNNVSQSLSSPIVRILFLQRTVGNRVMERLFIVGVIQTKLKIGQPDDIGEQEADRIAGQVMQIPEPIIQHKTGCPECPEREKEEEQISSALNLLKD